MQVLYRQHAGNTVGFTFEDKPVRERLNLDKAAVFAQGEEIATECAAFIERIAKQLPSDMQAKASVAANAMRVRARICQLRKQIYLPQTLFTARVSAFYEVWSESGYAIQRSRFSFGPRALFKDLLIGVPGTLKLLRK